MIMTNDILAILCSILVGVDALLLYEVFRYKPLQLIGWTIARPSDTQYKRKK